MTRRLKIYWIVGVVFLSFLALFFFDPISQSSEYHRFSDERAFLGIPNAMDVLSNLAFLIPSLLGFYILQTKKHIMSRLSWFVFFVGVFLVTFGSSYYHWESTSNTLMWDRLPMTLGFMGFFSAILSTYINPKIEIYLLPISILVGVGSVAYWRVFDDLRFYGWVQGMPFLCVLVALLLFSNEHIKKKYMILGMAFYAVAKIFEQYDAGIFGATGSIVSGHTFKHFFAALAPSAVIMMFFEIYFKKKIRFKASLET